MNALCHVTKTWAAWESRSKALAKTARPSYVEALLGNLEKSLHEAAEAHAEIVARQKLWTTWRASR